MYQDQQIHAMSNMEQVYGWSCCCFYPFEFQAKQHVFLIRISGAIQNDYGSYYSLYMYSNCTLPLGMIF